MEVSGEAPHTGAASPVVSGQLQAPSGLGSGGVSGSCPWGCFPGSTGNPWPSCKPPPSEGPAWALWGRLYLGEWCFLLGLRCHLRCHHGIVCCVLGSV